MIHLAPFVHGLILIVAPYVVCLLLSLITVLVLKYLASHKDDIAYATVAINLVKAGLGSKLGIKSNAILDAFEQGLLSVSDGTFTKDKAVDEIVRFITVAALSEHMSLDDSEIVAVRAAASVCTDMLQIKAAPTKAAVKIMVAQASVRASALAYSGTIRKEY